MGERNECTDVKSTYVFIMPYHYRALCPPYYGVTQGIWPYACVSSGSRLENNRIRRGFSQTRHVCVASSVNGDDVASMEKTVAAALKGAGGHRLGRF